ncbi:pentatricopeptide repeat-containing protein At2g13600-like [Cucurbita pepo subsp. pepo]|uniref:pentatricopeptide repeat-containing protein At2g13600-like n=1 Tax=Cucurbita pepo subsp. pepo TaxID=3664 RepID=UPI000C9D355F|nr:pentatricopeptide repeat-containing protein At2g13600-like [Cucurbita pepo subsp. pepo]XP_023523312.1 pentatricopeptide repeat-containing protein At2g13600-like [Cucurbita pepo subsp. pepo]
MCSLGAKLTKYSLCSALNSCAKTINLFLGLQIHAQIVKIGFEDNLYLNSALVNLYSKCNAIVDAKRIFVHMKTHDQVSWTSIISGLSQNGAGREAILMFKNMLVTQDRPNCFTYATVISSCPSLKDELPNHLTTLFHAHVIKLGFILFSSFVISSAIDCYSKLGRIEEAALLFYEANVKDNVIFNSMISGFSQNLYGEEALKLFVEMRASNLSPTDHTLTSVLNACGSLTVLEQGRQVHSLVTKMGSENNVFVVCSLLDMYSKCGSVDDAFIIFNQTVEKNSVLSTSMIMAFAQCGRGSDALKLFESLLTEEGFLPDHVCFTAVLTACNHAGLLNEAVEYFNKMGSEYRLDPQIDHYACLIDLYARNGHVGKAKELMEKMPYESNYVMWCSLLGACKVHVVVELGREVAYRLIEMDPSNAAPYVTLAHIYARAGLWTQLADIRKQMQQKRVRKSAGWSWIEIDKKAHVFSVGDATHPKSCEIYSKLNQLDLDMRGPEHASKALEFVEF